MILMYPYYVALFSLNSLVSFLVAVILWRRRHVPGGFCLFLLMIAAGIWAGSYAAEFMTIDPGHKIFWSKVSYLSIPYAGPLWFLFIMQYLGRDRWITPGRMVLFWTFPVLNMLLAFTNDVHGLVWTAIVPTSAEPGAVLNYSHGPALWADAAYSYTLMLVGMAYLLVGAARLQNLYRHQALAVILSLLFPLIANIAYLYDALYSSPLHGFNPTPLAFTVTGAILAFSIFRYHFLDLIPIARHTLVENMRNGMVVLDSDQHLIDFNPAAGNLLGLNRSHIGRPAVEAGHSLTVILDALSKNGDTLADRIVEMPESGRSLHAIPSLFEHRGRAAGNVINVQDITEQLRLERERKEIGDNLKKALSDIKTLQQFIPICSYCKKIRTDEGFWQQMESYISAHSDFVFSHSICPECVDKHFGWLDSPDAAPPENEES